MSAGMVGGIMERVCDARDYRLERRHACRKPDLAVKS
jgi:hypothetical protein